MAKRTGGFIGQDGLNAPDQATGVSASGGDGQATVSFTAPSDVGGAAITGFSVVSNTGATALSGSITASYDSKSFSVASQEGAAGGVQFKSDGTKMYVTGQTSDKTFQYSLSTPYDVSTASYDSVELNHATQVSNANPYDLFFKTDGTKLYVMFGINDTVYQYSLSTAWNLATASYDNVNFSVASQESGEPGGLAFSDDGSKMYVCGEGQATVFQYTLSTPWNLSTASYASKSFDVSSQDTKPAGLAFAKNGQLMLVVGEAQVKVFLYVLTTPFDVSTATYTSSSFSVSSQDPRPWYVALANNNTKMYVGGPNNDTVYQYTVDLSVDYPTASPVTVTGLTNGTSYTFNVWAINPFGWSSPSDASESVSPVATLAVFIASDNSNVMDYVTIATTGNAQDWGDWGSSVSGLGGGGNSLRGLGAESTAEIDYITYASQGNAVGFGNLTVSRRFLGCASNNTRCVWAGGNQSGSPTFPDTIDYVTIATTANAVDFGDLTNSERNLLVGTSNSTTGLFMTGVYFGTKTNSVDSITIASTGNSTNFGSLGGTARAAGAGASSPTRALYAGGETSTYLSEIKYTTIASTGSFTNFGSLTQSRSNFAGTSSHLRGVFGGGERSGSTRVNTIDYVTIATTANATDFGDLTVTKRRHGATGNGHGGVS